jgi:hypothetical protein
MLRIRGTIGDWPVDLTLELDEGDWAQLGAQLGSQLQATKSASAVPVPAPVSQDQAIWQVAKDLLRKAGQMSGPDLLSELEALTGSTAAGKRLLVRLRHSADVKVVSGADAPLYSWVS